MILNLIFASLFLIGSSVLFFLAGYEAKRNDGGDFNVPKMPTGKYSVLSDHDKDTITFINKEFPYQKTYIAKETNL